MIPIAQRIARAALRRPTVNRAVRWLACARGHRLVLVYHRLGPPVADGCEVVPSVPVELFRAHLQALGDVADLVTLDALLALDGHRLAAEGSRPAIAVTFDDDLPSHTAHALPLLRELGVRAAFFLSGRALHGLGPYWFQQLETLLVAHGEARVAALLERPGVQTATGLARECQQNADLRRCIVDLAADLAEPAILQRDDLTALTAAGMTVGFHTVDHGMLPDMDDVVLEATVSSGRQQLAVGAGAAVRHFAYPYGNADARTAAVVRRAGFDAAFTGRPEPIRGGGDRYRLGRWEPGPIGVDDLLVKLAVRLHRAAPEHGLS